TGIITGFKDYISQSDIANLNGVQYLLRANAEYNERRDAENAKLRAENVDFRDRLTKVEQNQTLQNALTANDNSFNNNSSNFASAPSANLVAEPTVTQHEKPSVDEEMDTSLPEEPIPEELTEVIISAVNMSVMDQYLGLPGTSDIPSSESSTSSHPIPNNPVLSEQNAKIKAPEIDIQPLIQELLIEPSEEDCVKVVNVEESDQSPAIELAHLYEKTKFAEIRTIRAKQDEIMSWYCYRKYFEKRHSEILPGILENGREKNSRAHVTSEIITGDATAPVESMVSVPNSLGDSKVIGPDNSPPIPPAPCVSASGQVSHVPIKISKFPEDRNIIYEAVRKRFPFLSWTKSITKYRDHFEYTNSEAKCPACTSIHTHRGIWGDWTCQSKDNFYYLMCPWDIHQNKKVKIATQVC
ncbi:15255_t:CDS:2, partial [Rhizophagus irregularis]